MNFGFFGFFGFLILFGLAVGFFSTQSYFAKIMLSQKIIDSKLNFLINHANIEYNQFSEFSKSVEENVKNGNLVKAAKALRVESGLGLKESMEVVKNLSGQVKN